MVALGKYLVIILENENIKKTGNLNEEELDKLQTLEKAQAQKLVLEDILYHTFISTSESMQVQMKDLSNSIEEAKAWTWEDKD